MQGEKTTTPKDKNAEPKVEKPQPAVKEKLGEVKLRKGQKKLIVSRQPIFTNLKSNTMKNIAKIRRPNTLSKQ